MTLFEQFIAAQRLAYARPPMRDDDAEAIERSLDPRAVAASERALNSTANEGGEQ